MKKILVLGIAAILTLGIASCTKSSNPSENTGGNTTLSESVKPSDSTSGGTTTDKQYIRVDKDENKTADGEYVLFGSYPQTYVSDTAITTALSSLIEDNATGYITYNGEEYKKVTAEPFESGCTFSDDTAIVSGTTYYFKVEPIKWRILNPTETNGTAMLFCDKILVSKAYQSKYEEKEGKYYNTTPGVPKNTYANNYEYSEIRNWLNNDFINATFTEAQKEIIHETEVDNSETSTDYTPNPYACANTNDKVFLLSYKEAMNADYGFDSDIFADSDEMRTKKGTDYAKAKGLYVYQSENKASCWWLRSPEKLFSDRALYVDNNGYIDNDRVYSTYNGVAPALNITL